MRTRLRLALATYLVWLVYFWIARALFLGYHGTETRALPIADLLGSFLHGFRLDASAAAYLTAIPVLLLAFSTIEPLVSLSRWLIRIWLRVVLVAASFLIATDLETFTHWDRRIDSALITYLATPREAWASAGASPVLLLIGLALALIVAGWWAFRRWIDRDLNRLPPTKPIAMIPLLLLVGVLVIPARGGVQLIPVNSSSAYFSGHPFANDAAGNALWGFIDSIYRSLYDRTNPFRAMPDSTARQSCPRRPPRERRRPQADR